MPLQLETRQKILVLSPHLDDGVLSVGGVIAKAATLGAEVVVATPFTAEVRNDPDLSPFASGLHASWSLGPNPYAARKREDTAAVGVVGGRAVYGQLRDSPFRADRDGTPLYPTRPSIFSTPSQRDDALESLAGLFGRWIDELQPDLVLGPLGVGRHVDHVLSSEAFRRVALERRLDVGLYEDMPYATGLIPAAAPDTVEAALARTTWQVSKFQFVEVDLPRKLSAISEYPSQLESIFPNGAGFESVLTNYMRLNDRDEGLYFERIWLPNTRP
jgi:LmbE family N-acetylglucosaminyl deacetylase